MNQPASRAPSRAFGVILEFLVLACGLAILWAGWQFETMALPGTRHRLDRDVVLGLGAAITAIALVLRFFPVGLSFAAFLLSLGAVGILWAGFQPVPVPGEVCFSPRSGLFRTWSSATDWLENFTIPDERLGYRPRPNVTARHHHRDFDAIYRINDAGWRATPEPKDESKGDIVFLGCSYTFGHGVADDEPYPAILAAEAWPDYNVRNYSLLGWATTHDYLLLEDLLKKTPLPKAVFYGYVDQHLSRNHRRKAWHGRNRNLKFPSFEVKDGKLVYLGSVPSSAAELEDGPELDKLEVELTVKLVEEMARMCKEKGVPFIVLVLNRDHDRMLDELSKNKDVSIVDVSDSSDDFYPNDWHPRSAWHRAVARAIASHPAVASATRLPELHRPDAVSKPLVLRDWNLSVNPAGHASATLVHPSDRPGVWRIDQIRLGSPEPWQIKLTMRRLPLVEKEKYVFRFRARSDEPRQIHYDAQHAKEPWYPLGLYGKADLTPEWKSFEVPFVAKRTDDDAAIHLQVGGSDIPVEFSDMHLVHDGEEVLPVRSRGLLASTAKPSEPEKPKSAAKPAGQTKAAGIAPKAPPAPPKLDAAKSAPPKSPPSKASAGKDSATKGPETKGAPAKPEGTKGAPAKPEGTKGAPAKPEGTKGAAKEPPPAPKEALKTP